MGIGRRGGFGSRGGMLEHSDVNVGNAEQGGEGSFEASLEANPQTELFLCCLVVCVKQSFFLFLVSFELK